MVTLKGEHIYLRALEPSDLDFLYEIENDEMIWEISNTQTPYSKYLLKQYLKESHKDIYEVKQLRLVICSYEDEVIGLIDIFDFDAKNRRAGIGIVIKDESNRGKGYGAEALNILINYSFEKLYLHQLYCNISEGNDASLKLFKQLNFEVIGLKKDWNLINQTYKNEYLLQLINPNVL